MFSLDSAFLSLCATRWASSRFQIEGNYDPKQYLNIVSREHYRLEAMSSERQTVYLEIVQVRVHCWPYVTDLVS